jgi:hypothetical protein
MNRVDFGRWKLVHSISAERTGTPGVNLAIGIAGAFDQAQGGGADGDDAASGGAGGIDAGGRVSRDDAEFGVHPVVFGVFDLDRQEGAGTDVQGDFFKQHPLVPQRLQQFRREMQPGCGGGNGAFITGKHRLIVAFVLLILRTFGADIGRQRHPAQPVQTVQHLRRRLIEAQHIDAVFVF